MKQLLLATAAVVGLSSAALAAEPVALTDSQLDNVTAGLPVVAPATPIAIPASLVAGGGVPLPVPPLLTGFPAYALAP